MVQAVKDAFRALMSVYREPDTNISMALASIEKVKQTIALPVSHFFMYILLYINRKT